MSEHVATIEWARQTPDFDYKTYNRAHTWTFDGGTRVPASAAPGFAGDPACVDPEEAFVAALSSCHMLFFLALAAKAGHTVDRYRDEAVGVLAKGAEGNMMITHVTLRPEVTFGGAKAPSSDEVRRLHDEAHHKCFIANSVRSEVAVEPIL